MNEPYILDTFPLLIPSKNFKFWKGDILLNMHSIYIEIYCPNVPKLDNLEVCIPELNIFNFHKFDLHEAVEIIKKKTHSLSEFLSDLISDLGKVWKQDLFSNQQNFSHHIYNNNTFYAVIQEVNLYSQFVYTIDDHLKHIKFNVLDLCKRNHFITVYIPDEYPVITKQGLHFETIVPSVIMNSLLRINTISKLLETFKCYVNELNNFWNVHEEIITTCNAIGPYTYEDVNYKIPIDHHVCVNVEIDPVNSKSCPKFNFHGQSETIEKFQLRLNQINPILIWNTENSFKDNILDIFGVNDIQSKYEEDIQEENIECLNNYCFICYDELDTVIKKQIKICDNEKCDAVYHMTCICVWLQNSGSMPMFEHLQGQCPQCEAKMLVALENFDLNKT